MGFKFGASKEKSGEIRLCVDFRNLNRALDKHNYPGWEDNLPVNGLVLKPYFS